MPTATTWQAEYVGDYIVRTYPDGTAAVVRDIDGDTVVMAVRPTRDSAHKAARALARG